MRFLILSAAALLLAASAGAGSGASSRAADNPNKLVCKNKATTGTRFPTRICHSLAQWEEIAEQSKRDARAMIDKPKGMQDGESPPGRGAY